MYIASAAWICLCGGVVLRRRTSLHIPLVLTAVATDYLLVLYLEYSRGALEKTFSGTLGSLELTHIFFSSLSLLLYIPTLAVGRLLRRGRQDLRSIHRNLGFCTLCARTLGFFFMFSMLK